MDVEACLSDEEFLSRIRSSGFKLSLMNRELYAAVAARLRACGLAAPEYGTAAWYSVYSVLVRLLRRGSGGPGGRLTGPSTPAAAVYAALYELYGGDAPRRMYELLEGLVTDALTGGGREARLLFHPVSVETLDSQLEVVAQLLRAEPGFCLTKSLYLVMCSVSPFLDRKSSTRCTAKLKKLCARG